MADIKKKLERLKRERAARAKAQPIKNVLGEIDSGEELTDESGLQQLKRKKQPHSRTDIIKEAWEEIDKDKHISVKDKLQQLITLTREGDSSKPEIPAFEPLEREPLQFIENPFPLDVKYGKVVLSSGLDIKGDVLVWLSKDAEFENLDLSTALFIDLETTGLSGGTGVVPFLVGMGYYRDDKFYVAQYFLGELAEEERMIQELTQFITEMNFQSVVSYNGKGFDLPLLETRFILYRQPFPLNELPHLDFLFSARNLWKHKYDNCRLFHLAREVVNADRAEDIPSAEIPWRYFQYLDTGNFDLIEPILYHNQEDILSLLGVVVEGALIFSEKGEDAFVDAMDLYGAGKVMEKVGDVEKSVQFFKKALDGKLSDEVSVEAKKKISYHFKKNQDWEKAVLIWKEMISAETASMSQLLSFRELAMYLEHKEKKFEEAREVAEEGFVMSMGFSSYYEKDFAHRRERLKQKIRQQKEKDAEPKKKQSAKKQSMKKQTKIKQPIKKQSKTKAKGK
jgi:uncharacterized protein YprB with RNaseH-like and TPR domain